MDDVTILQAGHQICADSVVVEGSIEVNESLITGEPDAIVKNAGDSLMSGSYVVSGRAKAKVVHVGIRNENIRRREVFQKTRFGHQEFVK